MTDLTPVLTAQTGVHPDRKTLHLWSLVLSSQGILNHLEHDQLLVSSALADQAMAEIMAYDAENRPQPLPEPLPDKSWVSLLILGALVLLSSWLGDQNDLALSAQADALRIRNGEWWRCLTALFLHADAGHLLANAAALGLLAPWLARQFGTGLVWGLFLLCGGMGNALNAWIHAAGHISIGASTGVFGLIGVLGGNAGGKQTRWTQAALVSIGFGFSFLALLGAGEERVDLGAHMFGLLCGLPLGLLMGKAKASGWAVWPGRLAGPAALLATIWAWVLACRAA